MKVYEAYTKGDEKVWLYSDDTFTLALSDCSDPELATETTETTPALLADIFSVDALNALVDQMQSEHDAGLLSIHALYDAYESKLKSAIAIAKGKLQVKHTVRLTADARVSTSVEVEATSIEEANAKAIRAAKEGNVIWAYDGVDDDNSIEVSE